MLLLVAFIMVAKTARYFREPRRKSGVFCGDACSSGGPVTLDVVVCAFGDTIGVVVSLT